MDRMKAARYGVLFYGTARESADGGRLMAYAAHALTRDLNGLTRFVCMPLARRTQCDRGAERADLADRLSVRGQPGRGISEVRPGRVHRGGRAPAR